MVDLSIAEGKLTVHVRGADRLWAFKSSLELPLAHIAGVRADPEAARGLLCNEARSGWPEDRISKLSVPGLGAAVIADAVHSQIIPGIDAVLMSVIPVEVDCISSDC